MPAGVSNIVLGYGNPVCARMPADERVDMVTFTGSIAVGKAIVRSISDMLKKVSLELGGKNPQVIFPDAYLESAIDAIVFGIYFNAGECCNAGSRIIVHEGIAEAVVARTVALSRRVPFGDPLNPETKVDAIISPEHQSKIDGYLKNAVEGGAEVRLGDVKQSGLGRELGRYGLEEFLEVKTVTMRVGRTRTPWVETRAHARAAQHVRQRVVAFVTSIFKQRSRSDAA